MSVLSHRTSKRPSARNGRTQIDSVIKDLARFRYILRKFLRFSENAARQCGVTPQQHQLMLGVAECCGRGAATISQLAEFLQERPHSALGLVERAEKSGLVRRKKSREDHRVVVVFLAPRGKTLLSRLSRMHYEEARRIKGFFGVRNVLQLIPRDKK